MSVKKEVLQKYKKQILIETGTYMGNTTKSAIENLGYKKAYTIELQDYLFQQAKENLKHLIEENKVVILKGNSNEKLKEVLNEINEPVTILLDAHIDGGNYVPNITPNVNWCPLYEEIQIIKNHHIKTHTILVDDVRIIGKEGWGSNVYIENIINQIKEINPKYTFTFEKGETKEDVLVATIME
jgi:hypothetical protein